MSIKMVELEQKIVNILLLFISYLFLTVLIYFPLRTNLDGLD